MSEKSINQFPLVTDVEDGDLVLIQRGDFYKSISVTNLGNGLYNAQLTLTSAQILLLQTTPIEIIAAQGAGTTVELLFASALITFNSIAYVAAGNLRFKYTGGADANFLMNFGNSFLVSAATLRHRANRSGVTYFAELENTGISVFVSTADPTTGNSTVVINALFQIQKL